jgi:hypothetical protein
MAKLTMSDGGGYALRGIVSTSSSPEQIQWVKHLDLHCLTSFTACTSTCDLAPDVTRRFKLAEGRSGLLCR